MNTLKSFYQTIAELLQNDGHGELSKFCNEHYMSDYIADHDNWDGGIDIYNIDLEIPVGVFGKWQSVVEGGIGRQEKLIEGAFETAVRGINAIRIGRITIRPIAEKCSNIEKEKSPLKIPLHFEVQVKQGQRSDYIGSVLPPKSYPCFILVFNWDWADYDYHTWFCLYYFVSADDRRKIGELKLMCSGQKNTMEILPKEFNEPLNNKFCSLGIKTDYYINLREKLKDDQLINEVQHYLCDCTFSPQIYERHCNEDIFCNSLKRDLSAVDALNEGQALAMGIKPDDMYSFMYTYHPKYDEQLYAHWNVRILYEPLRFMRTIGIIGDNGVGKTQILSKFVTDLLIKNEQNFKLLPHFKNLLVVCSTPFDDYPKEEQGIKDVLYKKCILEQDKVGTVKELTKNLTETCSRPTVDKQSMLSLWMELSKNYVDATFVNHVTKIVKDQNGNEEIEVIFDALEDNVRILSSGQLHILSLVTYICANIHYRSLLIIDEPEVHLHPHITMEFIAVLSNLLTMFKSYAIIATHTPLVVREIAGKNVFLMQKMQDGIPQITPVGFETLGEDVATLYHNLFGYDEKSSYFKRMVDEFCDGGKDYDWIIKYFQQGVKLNVNAHLIIRDAIEARDNA